jgi:tetratricopeptide (TPR) repeat protein
MAKQKDEPIVDVEQAFTKTELYFEENKKSIFIILGAIVAMVGLYLGYKYWYVAEQEVEAQAKIYPIENYFAKDSFNLVISGTANTPSAEELANDYGVTLSGNLSHYMLGISYLKTGQYELAIEHLKEFESDDVMVSSVAIGATGDAYMELGNIDEAISHYLKAADHNKNKFTTPLYLKKAALAYEEKGNYQDAIKIYEQIKTDYPESTEGKEMEKYIARAKELSGTGA